MDNHTANASSHTSFNNATNTTFHPFEPPPPKGFWTGLILPVAYLAILIAALSAFSSVYRQRQLARAAKLEPWFPAHPTRDLYLSLLHLDPAAAGGRDEKTLKQVPDSVLKAALLKRAVDDIRRILLLRQAKPALQTLLQRGSVGEELWQRFQRAEADMEAEVKDVVSEANAFAPNWGQVIFQSANEINQNALLKERVVELQGQLGAEREWWERRREGIRTGFLAELEGGTGSEVGPGQRGAEVRVVEAGKRMAKSAARSGGSDDDAVLVEGNVPEQVQGGGKKKHRKK